MNHPGHTKHDTHNAHVSTTDEALTRHTSVGVEQDGHGGGHGDHGAHQGHHVEMFRRRFWWSLLLTVPLVVTSHMVMDWFGYELDFPGIEWVGPVLGSFLFFWGGKPFLSGGIQEARARTPGMMLLIAMAITVAYIASMTTSLGWFDLDFWWELGALISIMLLGHWQEMKALGQAQDALSALAALLPDEAERISDDGAIETVPSVALQPGEIVLVRSGGRVPADGAIVDGAAELDESMITGESRPVAKTTGDRVVAGTVSTDSAIRIRVTAVGDDTALAGIGRLVAEAQAVTFAKPGPRRQGCRPAVLRRHRCGDRHRHRLGFTRRPRRGSRASRHRARHLLPARSRPGHPADHLAVQRNRCP